MRGVITFVFDDGYAAVYEHVVPLLREHGLSAVFALPLNTSALAATVAEPLRPWTEWLSLQSEGYELAAHGIHHRDLRHLSAAELVEELREPQRKLDATTLVYPGGAHNETVIQTAQRFYSAARTTGYGFEALPPQDTWRLKTVDYTRDNWSLTKANGRALWAWAANKWLIETYHFIDPAAVDKEKSAMHHSVPLADFKRHLEFIRKLPIGVKTINETLRHSHN